MTIGTAELRELDAERFETACYREANKSRQDVQAIIDSVAIIREAITRIHKRDHDVAIVTEMGEFTPQEVDHLIEQLEGGDAEKTIVAICTDLMERWV